MSIYFILAFYIVLIGVFLAIGAYLAQITQFVFEKTGALAGFLVGVFVSYYLWIRFGRQMAYRMGVPPAV